MYTIYQVEYGDTLEKIAGKANTTVNNIKSINGINNDSELVIGGLIVVPKSNNMFFQSYKVKKGDSIYSIARMYNVDTDTLLMLNGLNKDDYIYPDQEIIVPENGVQVYVTKNSDTIDFITTNLGVDANELARENNRIFVVPDQVIVHRI